jgi:adenylate cyclase
VERRLVAILAADVAGYSRLMGVDEAGTVSAFKAHRSELVDAKIAEHQGRIFKLTGDGMLVEFPSVVNAVACATAVQRGMAERNALVPPERRMDFRIGVNLGDVIVEGDDIFGDGVNVAARLEAIAQPGGIAVSATVHDHIGNRVDISFDDLGEHALKNIARPVRVYHAWLGSATARMPIRPELALPDKPSIAVLPFQNMSGDSEQEYFADGMVEDIITALSRMRWLLVIARNSSFTYKGRAVNVKQVGRELGVRYVLEGSVRKSGARIRITAQLVDALAGAHHWAERYDRDVTDMFELQDEIVQQVVGAIEPRLLAAEGVRSQSRAPADLDAWEMVARAMSRYWHVTAPDIEAAIAMLKEAVGRHPDYGPAHSMLAFGLVLAGHLSRTTFEIPKLATDSARRAAELDDSDPWAHLALGYVAFVGRQTEEAVAQFRRAIELNPNFAAAHGYLGYPLAFDGQSNEAIASLLLAIRLSPHDRQNPIFMAGVAVAHYLAKRYDKAIEWGRKAVQQAPGIAGIYRILIASLAQAGQISEAHMMLARLRELQPEISLAWAERTVPYTPAQMPHFLEGLRKAGLQ